MVVAVLKGVSSWCEPGVVSSLRTSTPLLFLKRDYVGLWWEYRHSYGDVPSARHFKREERMGTIQGWDSQIECIASLENISKWKGKERANRMGYIMCPSENELYC